MRDLLFQIRDRFDYALCMCPTMESATMLKTFIPPAFVYEAFMLSKVEEFIRIAQNTARAGRTKHFLLVLDDCMYDKSICRSQAFRFLFYNGRHVRITALILVQYLVDLPPDMRANVDYVFTCREPVLANRIKLYKLFFGIFATFDDFCQALDRCTQNFEILVMDNTATNNNLTECIFWYKADATVPEFAICSPKLRSACERLQHSEEQQQDLAGASVLDTPDSSRKGLRGKKTVDMNIIKEEEPTHEGGDGCEIEEFR